MRDDQVSRRRVLTGLAATLLVAAGCSPGAIDSPPTHSPHTDPDDAIRRAAAESERELLTAYAATLARHPALGERLVALSTHHSEHLAAFGAPTASPTATGTSPTAGTTAPAPGESVPSVPDDPVAAVAALAATERVAAGQRLSGLASASPELARLLASSAGAEAAHAALLGS